MKNKLPSDMLSNLLQLIIISICFAAFRTLHIWFDFKYDIDLKDIVLFAAQFAVIMTVFTDNNIDKAKQDPNRTKNLLTYGTIGTVIGFFLLKIAFGLVVYFSVSISTPFAITNLTINSTLSVFYMAVTFALYLITYELVLMSLSWIFMVLAEYIMKKIVLN